MVRENFNKAGTLKQGKVLEIKCKGCVESVIKLSIGCADEVRLTITCGRCKGQSDFVFKPTGLHVAHP